MRILITRRINQDAVSLLQETGYKIEYFKDNVPLSNNYLINNIGLFDAVLTTVSDNINKKVLNSTKGRLKIISNMAVGLDNIDVEFAKKKGISVFNTPNVVSESTADLTITLAFALIRKIHLTHDFIRKGAWKSWDPEIFIGREFTGLNWGIIGFGNIGRLVAKKLSGFEMNVNYFDLYVEESSCYAKKIELDDLLLNADVISVHIPLNEKTRNFINTGFFSKMKTSSILVNMARGEIINSSDLIFSLKSNQIAGAALDVFDPEPIPQNHEIFNFDNVIITPHIGTATQECRREMALLAAQNIIKNLK